MTNTTEHFDFNGEDNDLMAAMTSVYVYRVARSGWYVGLAPGDTKGMLYNPTNSTSLPKTGWQYWGPGGSKVLGVGNEDGSETQARLHVPDEEEKEDGKPEGGGEVGWGWVTDSTIKITKGTFDWCDTVYVKGEGVSLDCKMFGKFIRSNKLATGRPVYYKDNDNQTALHASSGGEWQLTRGDEDLKITLPDDEPLSTLNPVLLDVWSKEAEVSVTSTCSDISLNTTTQQGKIKAY